MSPLIVISLIWFLSEVGLSYMKRSSGGAKDLDKSSLRIIWITIALGISVGVFVATTGEGTMTSYAKVAYWTGMICIFSGLLIRWIAIFQLKQHFTVNVSISEDHRLIQRGLYKHVRHPAYTGSLLSFFGLGLAMTNWLSLLVIFTPILLAFLYRISVEEAELGKSFGHEYDDYTRTTKRLIPGVY